MVASFRTRMTAGLSLLAFIVASQVCLAQTASPLQLAGRSVAAQLVKADDLSPVQASVEALTLIATPVQMTKQQTLFGILQGNGVVPDTEAICLVYDLNPTLKDIKDLKVGGVVQVPKVTGGQDAQRPGNGYLVALTVDPQIRQTLNQGVDALQTAAARFAELPPDRFESPAARGSAQQNVATLARWYAQIKRSFLRRTGPPLRRQTLLQLTNEVEVLNALIDRLAKTGQKLTTFDQDQIGAIYQDLESEIVKYNQVLANQAPPAETLYKIVVNIKGDDLRLIEGLRVYYTYNGIFRDPPVNPPVTSYPFRQLGSGRFELLPVKNYKVWAARDGDPGHPLTPPLMMRVSPLAGDTQQFDLSLAKGQPR